MIQLIKTRDGNRERLTKLTYLSSHFWWDTRKSQITTWEPQEFSFGQSIEISFLLAPKPAKRVKIEANTTTDQELASQIGQSSTLSSDCWMTLQNANSTTTYLVLK
ncbi:hypothetical protein F8M41_004166 [Gigaspora margarita]|uniref:Uncharacterized protein n=1 Tax=Gigaspora margarita TaxID=4874 RepID=A0A8H3XBM5_GIGMA|nr:hypothetical protein F8M41_004166 [Gigaspora margarita]